MPNPTEVPVNCPACFEMDDRSKCQLCEGTGEVPAIESIQYWVDKGVPLEFIKAEVVKVLNSANN